MVLYGGQLAKKDSNLLASTYLHNGCIQLTGAGQFLKEEEEIYKIQ